MVAMGVIPKRLATFIDTNGIPNVSSSARFQHEPTVDEVEVPKSKISTQKTSDLITKAI